MDRALRILKNGPNPGEEGNVYRSLGNLAMRQRDHRTALSFLELALARYTTAGDRNGEADIRRGFGETALRTGDNERAKRSTRKRWLSTTQRGIASDRATPARGSVTLRSLPAGTMKPAGYTTRPCKASPRRNTPWGRPMSSEGWASSVSAWAT